MYRLDYWAMRTGNETTVLNSSVTIDVSTEDPKSPGLPTGVNIVLRLE